MDIVVADLKNNTVTKVPASQENGLTLGLSLYKEYGEDAFVMTSAVEESVSSCGTNSWCMVYYSQYLGHRAFAQFTTAHGLALLSMGIKALVIIGRSDRLKFLSVYSENIEIIPCEHLRASGYQNFVEVATRNKSDFAISTGVASDKGVKFGTLQTNGRNMPVLGAGNAFHLHNLKGVVIQNFAPKGVSHESNEKKRMIRNRFIRDTRGYGAYSFLLSGQRLGWIPVNYYRDRFDPRAYSLDGKAMAERFGNYPESCSDCFIACGRRKRDNTPLPRWRDLMALGTNLSFFDPENVQKLFEACVGEGLDTRVVGGLLAYIHELPLEEQKLYGITGHHLDEYCALIHRISTGSILSDGLLSFPDAIQGYDGRPVVMDLRGAYSEAIMMSLGYSLFLPATTLLPKKPVNAECAAILAFYETLYVLAFMTLGYPSFATSITYWAWMPEAIYHVPFLARLAASRFTAFGHSAQELQEIGLATMEELGMEWHSIPTHFTMNSESVFDSATVPMRRLREVYSLERLKVEMAVKSRREKSSKKSGKKSPAVGPAEDLGNAADPGLNK